MRRLLQREVVITILSRFRRNCSGLFGIILSLCKILILIAVSSETHLAVSALLTSPSNAANAEYNFTTSFFGTSLAAGMEKWVEVVSFRKSTELNGVD